MVTMIPTVSSISEMHVQGRLRICWKNSNFMFPSKGGPELCYSIQYLYDQSLCHGEHTRHDSNYLRHAFDHCLAAIAMRHSRCHLHPNPLIVGT